MSDPKSQTTEPLTLEERAAIIHNSLAERHGLPKWDDCDAHIQASWIKCVQDCDEVAKGITYDE